jgi:transposase
MHPEHALSRWFRERTGGAAAGRIRKVMSVAMARKLLILLWKLVNQGVFPDGLRLKAA